MSIFTKKEWVGLGILFVGDFIISSTFNMTVTIGVGLIGLGSVLFWGR